MSFGQVLITELADPDNDAAARYVEIYNAGSSAVDMTSWSLRRYTNGNADLSSNVVDLSTLGSLASGAFAIIASDGANFQTVYGVAADISTGTGGPADSNGDDQIVLYNASEVLVDIFGVPGEDGRAERKATVTSGNTTWNEAEWNVWVDSTISVCSSHTNSVRTALTDFDPKAWIGTTANTDPTISATSQVTELNYFEGNGPSAEKTIAVSGVNLTNDITITSFASFEISITSGSGFVSSLTLTQSNGTVSSTTIYVRLISGLGVNTYSENISVTSSGATDQMVAVSGEVSPADAQFSFTAFLNDFNYVVSVGGPSPEQTFSVQGLFLTDDIVITAPEDFEVSLTSDADFANSVNISTNSGTVAETTVYVRLKASLSAGNYTGDIAISSTGVADKTISINGNAFGDVTNSMVITGVYDGSLTGGTPKGIEIFVLNDIADLSLYGVSSVSNGGGSTAGNVEFSFPEVSATSGSFIYVSNEAVEFDNFFGFAPNYTDGSMNINGDDAIELYENGQIIDVYGDVDNDFSDTAYDYLDGWAYRKSNTGPEGTTFTATNWTYSAVNGLEGGTNNTTATSPFPIGTYKNTTASVKNNQIEGFATYPNPVTNNSFTITSNSTDKKEVKIFNILGKNVFTASFSNTKSTLNIPTISAGLYILKVTEGTKRATSKLVIK